MRTAWDWLITRDWRTIGPLLFTATVSILIFLRQNKLDHRIEGLQSRQAAAQEEQAEAQNRMANALIQRFGEAKAPDAQPAMLSAQFVGSGAKSVQLVVVNQGPGEATLTAVDVLNAPDLLVDPELGMEGRRLLKGEEVRILAAPSLGTPRVVRVGMTWIDSEGAEYRVQDLDV